MTGRRVWFARDAWLTADPVVETLAAEYGAEGILCFEEMLAITKIANDGGRFTTTYGQLAKRSYLKSKQLARRIVAECETLGLIQLTGTDGPNKIHGQVPRWSRWNDPKAAERKADQRAREVTAKSHAQAENVTELRRDNGGAAS